MFYLFHIDAIENHDSIQQRLYATLKTSLFTCVSVVATDFDYSYKFSKQAILAFLSYVRRLVFVSKFRRDITAKINMNPKLQWIAHIPP